MNLLVRSFHSPAPLFTRCLKSQQVRAATFLSNEDLVRAVDDQIRATYPKSSAAEVKAVVEARRGIWVGLSGDKRTRNDDKQASKRQRIEGGEDEKNIMPIYATKFSEDAIKAEERRPKKKVAVLIGYSGAGYRGMQLTHDQKTIEGDLFQAFVSAGAISKANADDPKKSSFVRCARTDKGVHAAGNVISLKLIVEDENIVEKINENLSSQIRVWGFERTNNSFSAYQLCDSRIYEYLIPTHSFLPPHPSSFLGRKIVEIAKEKNDEEGLRKRQDEVQDYWDRIDEELIGPILREYDEETRAVLEKALYLKPDTDGVKDHEEEKSATTQLDGSALELQSYGVNAPQAHGVEPEPTPESVPGPPTEAVSDAQSVTEQRAAVQESRKPMSVAEGIKRLRNAYMAAKRAYRIDPSRLRRVRNALTSYEGTHNYHNYTIQKSSSDPSAKRVIKSFVVNPEPLLINGTEWLSMKVHGQSFMMHQIRKMVGMVALVVRCGCDPRRIMESYGHDKISIPKAPSLGLLLERPVFDSYNKRAKGDLGKEAIDFDKYKTEMAEFKQREIYERMYRSEEKDNIFGNFFSHVDNFPDEAFLWVTSGGIAAAKVKIAKPPGKIAAKDALAAVDGDDSDEEVADLDNVEEG